MTGTTSAIDQAPRRRPAPRAVNVVRIEDLGPRMRRVTFGGESLQGFGPARPGAHIKLFFSDLPADWQPVAGQPRPTSRTYTPRHFDAARGELVIDFVRHGAGVASDWVEQAQPGSPLTIAGPGGGHDFEPDLRRLILLADESALPAAGMIIDAAGANCSVTLIAEVEDEADQIAPSNRAIADLRWLHRAPTQAAAGSLLLAAARSLTLDDDGAMCWVACEAVAMRAIKAHLTVDRGLDRSRLISRGYWKQGATDHPDHDSGE